MSDTYIVQTFQETKDLLVKLNLMSFSEIHETFLGIKRQDPGTIKELAYIQDIVGVYGNFLIAVVSFWEDDYVVIHTDKVRFTWLIDMIDHRIPITLEERTILTQLHSRLNNDDKHM